MAGSKADDRDSLFVQRASATRFAVRNFANTWVGATCPSTQTSIELEVYHRALEHKEFYAKEFLKQTAGTIANGFYDASKLEAGLDLIVAECTAIAVGQSESSVGEYELRRFPIITFGHSGAGGLICLKRQRSRGPAPEATSRRRGEAARTVFPF